MIEDIAPLTFDLEAQGLTQARTEEPQAENVGEPRVLRIAANCDHRYYH